MEIINKYFGKVVFVKVDLREEHAVYTAALSSSFQDGKKQYALAFVPIHLAIVDRGYLSDLNWVNFQTRTLTNGYRMPPQRWDIAKGIDNPMFTMVERTQDKTKYVSDQYPLEMVLIHDPRKKSKLQYHNHMNLLAALVTFKCVISLIDSRPNLAPVPSQPISRILPLPVSHYLPPSKNTEETAASSLEYGPNTSYTPVENTGRYISIGLSDYVVPQVSPQQASAQRRSATPKSISARPQEMEVNDSFELL